MSLFSHSSLKSVFAILLTFVITLAFSQPTPIESINLFSQPVNGSFPVFEKIEIGLELTPQTKVNNPYDPSEVLIKADLKHLETGETTVISAFYYQEFKDSPKAISGYNVKWEPAVTQYPYRLRFVLPEPGTYELNIFSLLAGENDPKNASLVDVIELSAYLPEDKPNPGYLSFPEDRVHLKFSNGDPFFALGMNISFYGDLDYRLDKNDTPGSAGPGQDGSFVYAPSTLSYYQEKIDLAAKSGMNYLRIILAPWTFDLEWENAKVGNYDGHQYQLSDLDEIIRMCEQSGIYLQLSIFDHTYLKRQSTLDDPQLNIYCWENSPYKKDLDLESPKDFFADQRAREFFKRRINYIYSRWGYSPNLAAVELISETGNYDEFWGTPENNFKDNDVDIVNDWCIEMAEYCKTIDERILVTTGLLGFPGIQTALQSPHFDFASPHMYGSFKNMAHLNASIVEDIEYLMEDRYGLDPIPIQLGETGQRLWFNSPNGEIKCPESDITQIHFHNSMWSTSFMGGFGTSLPWSQREIFSAWGNDWGQGYRYFLPLSKFVAGENFHEVKWKKLKNECNFNISLNDIPQGHYGMREIETCQFNIRKNNIEGYQGITTKMANGGPCLDVAAFGIKSPTKVLGWVQNMNNYWYNLIGGKNEKGGNSISQIKCLPYVDHPKEGIRPRVDPIEGVTLTVNDLTCSGDYDIEWWSSYTDLDVNSDGNPHDGGGQITNPATLKDPGGRPLPGSVKSESKSLTVTVPRLAPLTPYDNWRPKDHVFAPDYGFKFIYRPGSGKPTEERWTVRELRSEDGEKVSASGGLASSGNGHIFFRNDEGQIGVVPISENNCNGAFYPLKDQMKGENAAADNSFIAASNDGKKIAYVGVDGAIHFLVERNNEWSHIKSEYTEDRYAPMPGYKMSFNEFDQLIYQGKTGDLLVADANFSDVINALSLNQLEGDPTPSFGVQDFSIYKEQIFIADKTGIIHLFYQFARKWNTINFKNLQSEEAYKISQGSQIAVGPDAVYYANENGNINCIYLYRGEWRNRVLLTSNKDKILPNSKIRVDEFGNAYYIGKDKFVRMVRVTETGELMIKNFKSALSKKKGLGKANSVSPNLINVVGDESKILYMNKNGIVRRIASDAKEVNRTILQNEWMPIITIAEMIPYKNDQIYFIDNRRNLLVLYKYNPCGLNPCLGLE